MSWYSPWEEKGRRLRKWIDRDHEPGCPYPISTFAVTYKPPHRDYAVAHEYGWLDPTWDRFMYPIDLSDDLNYIHIEGLRGPPVGWEGRTGQGVVFLDWIRRSRRSTAPHISEFTKAAYEMEFPLETLRYVFVTDISETDTVQLVRDELYRSQGLQYPNNNLETWTPGPEYDALLGTPIGKTVAAFVLCAWGQGIKRIARIVTFHDGQHLQRLNMRFDIEVILR
ncbi:hypothetical protein N7517_001148 [Penicillium concentricum]|uniref:Uncharacterized protein n=1 Tax=Penicillium concentricum TaxID=293559 RepID=A0A9W9SRJ2_9EURO|nr:uncharacterized protein N7517_001148 [Penicillium concentricum]KAJ5383237.1 hypothetical protein N7517_001148 [Penicillium concentricum]